MKKIIGFLIITILLLPLLASAQQSGFPVIGSTEHQEQLEDYWEYIRTGEVDIPPYEYNDGLSVSSNDRRRRTYESNQNLIIVNELINARVLDLATMADSSLEGYQPENVRREVFYGAIIEFSVDGRGFLTTSSMLEEEELAALYSAARAEGIQNPESYDVLLDLHNELRARMGTAAPVAGGSGTVNVGGVDNEPTTNSENTEPVAAGTRDRGIVPDCEGNICGYDELVQLANNIIDFIVVVSIPVAVIGFMYAGFLILTAGADSGKVSQGKELFMKIGIGFFFVLAAWLIVNLVTSVLFVGEGFNRVE